MQGFSPLLCELQAMKSVPFLLVGKLKYKVRGLKRLVWACGVSVQDQGVKARDSCLSEGGGKS